MKNPFNNQNDDPNNPNNPFSNLPVMPNYASVVKAETGAIRIAKVGFSWTTLIFGPVISVFRGDWYNLAVMLGLNASVLLASDMFGLGVAPVYALYLLWPFIYNMMYFRHLFNIGYIPVDEHSLQILTSSGYLKHAK